jgi:hypothetical protein
MPVARPRLFALAVDPRLSDEDVERIARRVVAKIVRLVLLVVLAFVVFWALLPVLLYAVRASSGGSTGATGWLIALVIATVLFFALAAWRLVRRGL